MSSKHANNSRYQVVESLWLSFPDPAKSTGGGQALSTVLNVQLQGLDPSQKPLAKNICYGVFRHYFFLNALVQKQLQKPMRNKDRDILFLLLAANYELLFLNTPKHAVVSEFVEVCQLRKKVWAKGLVNAVLRNIQRLSSDATTLKKDLLETKKPKNIGFSPAEVKFEHPYWLIKKLNQNWGEQADSILLENNLRSPMTLRVNKSCCSAEDYLQLLLDKNINAHLSDHTSCCIYLSEAIDVYELPNFSEGWVSVQDEAAQQAAHLLDLQPSQKVLDACSAPGGKSGHLLELESTIQLTCLDHHEKRLGRVEENLERLNFTAKCMHADASNTSKWWDGSAFDRILLDAPCSATGIIRRNPDIKLQRSEVDIERMSKLQSDLLDKLWPCLAKGGLFLYATCSVLKAENENVISAFLKRQSDAKLQVIDLTLGQARDFGHQFFPSQNGPDGFFYALLRKR